MKEVTLEMYLTLFWSKYVISSLQEKVSISRNEVDRYWPHAVISSRRSLGAFTRLKCYVNNIMEQTVI